MMYTVKAVLKYWGWALRSAWGVTRKIGALALAYRLTKKHGIDTGAGTIQFVGLGGAWINVRAAQIADVAPFLRDMAQAGHRPVGIPTDCEGAKSRGYGLTGGLTVWVRLEQPAVGPACRFVQVGTKTEPVYELRCDEAAS